MTFNNLSSSLLTSRVGHLISAMIPSTIIWDRDWDICCILDGCRYDLVGELNATGHEVLQTSESIESIWSAGSQSAEWMDNTFSSRFATEMDNTALITGNPFTAQECEHIQVTSGDVLPLTGDEFGLLYEAWRDEWVDAEISTIPPEPLTDAAISIWHNRNDLGIDKIIVHYMQPHAPFRSRPEWFLGAADRSGWGQVDVDAEPTDADVELSGLSREELLALEELAAAETEDIKDPWTRVRDGELPFDEFWEAYRDNLTWVLDDIQRLLQNCTSDVVLTSDHGNAAGEFGVWSHPPGTPIPSLRRVPWIECRGQNTEVESPPLPTSIQSSEPTHSGDTITVEERLTALGYR